MNESLICERRGTGMWATFNRPNAMNAISPSFIAELDQVISAANDDDAVSALVITGSGKAFCAGADLRFVESLQGDPTAIANQFLRPLSQMLRRLRSLPKPVIAVVNGHCVAGGLELMLCCDLVVAAERGAAFSDGHARYGLLPAIGGPQGLARSVGMFKAKEMLFTADRYSAEQMERAGMVNWVVPDDELGSFTDQLVAKLATGSQLGIAAMKQMVNDGVDVSWDVAARYDLALNERHLGSGVPQEGVKAFVEGRTPTFARGVGADG